MGVSDEIEKVPEPSALAQLGVRAADRLLLADVRAGMSLSEIAERHGLGNPRKAGAAINRALERLDRRLIDSAPIIRAGEFVQLSRMSAALEDRMGDPKVAAELRLQSEARTRLYGVQLQREIEVAPPTINVLFALPEDRGGAEVTDAEVEEVVPQLEAETSPPEDPED